MTKKQLIVKVSTVEDSLAKFKNVWERAEKGKKFNSKDYCDEKMGT